MHLPPVNIGVSYYTCLQGTRSRESAKQGALITPTKQCLPAHAAMGNRCVSTTLRRLAKRVVTRQMQRKKRSSVTCHGRLSL